MPQLLGLRILNLIALRRQKSLYIVGCDGLRGNDGGKERSGGVAMHPSNGREVGDDVAGEVDMAAEPCEDLIVGSEARPEEAVEGGDVGARDAQEDVIAVLDAQHQDGIQLPVLQAPMHC